MQKKYWFYYHNKTFYPKHGAFCTPYDCETDEDLLAFWEKHLVHHFEVGINENERYLLTSSNVLTSEVVSLGEIFRNRQEYVQAGKTPPYSAIVTGKFYKWNNEYYYEGGFSIV